MVIFEQDLETSEFFQVRKGGRIPDQEDNLSPEYVKSEFYQSLKMQLISSLRNFSEEAQKGE